MGIITGIGAIVGIIADFGCSSLISNAATTFATKSGNKIFDKVMISVGGAVLAGIAGEAAQNFIKEKANSINESIKKNDIYPVRVVDEEIEEEE